MLALDSALTCVDVSNLTESGSENIRAQLGISLIEVSREHHSAAEPLFFEGPIDDAQKKNFQADTSGAVWVGTFCIRDAVVLGKGLIIAGGKNILMSPYHMPARHAQLVHPNWKSSLMPSGNGRYRLTKPVKLMDIKRPCALLMRGGDHIYGHWLLDILPRLQVLKRSGLKDMAYVVSSETPEFAKELLSLAGVQPDDLIESDEQQAALFCKELYWPTLCRVRSVLSDVAAETFKRLARCCESAVKHYPERIYLPRAQWWKNKRRLVNSDEVAMCLEKHGFERLHPEEFSFREQIARFKKAKMILAECGSAPHNSVFSPRGTRVGILQGNHSAIFIQSAVGRVCGQPTGYLFGESFVRPGNGINGDYLISIDTLDRILSEQFNDV